MSFFTVVYSLACFLLVLLPGTEAVQTTFTTIPPSLTKVEGQNMTLIWDISFTGSQVYNAKVALMKTLSEQAYGELYYSPSAGTVSYRKGWTGLEEKIMLNVTISGQTCKVVVTMKNLNKTTDQGYYVLYFSHSDDSADTGTADKATLLTVNIPPRIVSSHPYTISTNETKTVQLVCNATGFPTPTINWTRNGVVVGTRSPFSLVAKPEDHNICYTCVAFNGVYDPQKADVCFKIQFKPYGAHQLTVNRSTVCQNDTVTLTCKSGPANPATSKYKFFYNNVLVQNSPSNVYSTKVTHGYPDMNRFSCIPSNLFGDALNNVTINITAKVTPTITTTTPNPVVVEGSDLNLTCSVAGTSPLTVTWTRVGKANRQGTTYSITNIRRHDEGSYHCTVDNGVECPVQNATINVTVNFKPENTSISTNRDNNTFVQGENITLHCLSLSKPQRCNVTFYNGSDVMQTYTDKTCNGGVAASYVLPNIDGCGLKSYSCKVENEYGTDSFIIDLTYTVPAASSTTPSSNTVVLEEGSSLDLNCSTTGCPDPNVTWTKEGLSNHLESKIGGLLMHRFTSLAKSDLGTYVCTVDNGVIGSPVVKKVFVNVTHKPYQTSMTTTHTRSCINETVTLSCSTSANPPVQEYRFYINDKVVHTSSSGVYQFPIPLSGNNTYRCEPKNEIGYGANATVIIATKDPPKITFSSPSKTFIEGQSVSLVCNVTGSEPLNITWRRFGGISYPEGSIKEFTAIGRQDEAVYQCVAHNGDECPVASINTTITVIYEPENTSLLLNKSGDALLINETIKLTCQSSAKPQQCHVMFYHGDQLLANKSSSTCSADHVINVQGCNKESFWCIAVNKAGTGVRAYRNVTVKVPSKMVLDPSVKVLVKEEGESLVLNCSATGCPTPNISWTKQGRPSYLRTTIGNVLAHEFTSLNKSDTGFYRCSIDNGVPESDTLREIYLNVTYKPYQTRMTTTRSKGCLNDSVTLSCTTSANPPVQEYRFYINDKVVHTSSSGVYQFPMPLSGNNTYRCEPKNEIGYGANASVMIATKDPAKITLSSSSKTLIEGQSVSLVCNVTGSEPRNITWRRLGGISYPAGFIKEFTAIGRQDEAVYQCAAHNGDECPAAFENFSLIVNYKPENTSLTLNKSSDVFQINETIKLTCQSSAKPQHCHVMFYHGDQLLANKPSSTCSADHVTNVQGCNKESFWCLATNEAGTGARAYQNATVKVPSKLVLEPSVNILVKEEGEFLVLNCSATGCPIPNIAWTKQGQLSYLKSTIGNALAHEFTSLNKSDTGLYRCSVDNGVAGGDTLREIYLNVTYKPYQTEMITTHSRSCLNDSVTLSCTTSANPPVQEYRFYINDKVVHTSSSGVYQFPITQSGNNTYKCEPKNPIGYGANATAFIITKDPPKITFSFPGKTFIEGQSVSLVCNVTGSEFLNIKWRRLGGISYSEGSVKQFTAIGRQDEAMYQCAAHNGDECPSAFENFSLIVNYKPENTSFSLNKSGDVLLINETVKLTCQSSAKPQHCHVMFYHGDQLLANKSSSTCSADHVIKVQGCNKESFWCIAENDAGTGARSYRNVTVKVPAKMTTQPSSQTILIEEGERLIMNCSSTGCPKPNITWTKRGQQSYLKRMAGNTLSYEFTSLNKSDTGYYRCSVDNGVAGSDAFREIYLNVTYKPRDTRLESSHNKSCLNDSVTLSCSTSANPPTLEYRFYINDKVVHTSSSGVYQFPIPLSGNNTYRCEPKNQIGFGANASVKIATRDPPIFSFYTPSKSVLEGESVSLVCNVTGSEPLNITWRRLGGISYPEGSVKQFTAIGRQDEAVYQCTAHNGKDCPVVSINTTITVMYKPENTTLCSSTSVACHNDEITLICSSHSKPPIKNYQILRNGISIANVSNGIYTYNMSVNGTNVYTCVPENIVGPGESANVTIQVKVSPIIRSVTPSQDVTEGNNLELKCNVWDNSGSLKVSWHKLNGNDLSNGSSYTLTSIQRSQTGSYECRATNGNECKSKSHQIDINVKYQPSILKSSSTPQTIDENDDIVLQCKTDGYPIPVISWLKIDNSNNVIHTGDTLVRKATPATKGTYRCSVSNGVGPEQTAVFVINVLGYCGQHQCRPGSFCVSKKKSYYCSCTRGLRGKHCEMEDPLSKRFLIFLVFVKPQWTDKFKDSTSVEFKDFETKSCRKMFSIFGSVLIFCSVKYMRFGSVETELELRFNQSKLESEVEETIKNATTNGTMFTNELVFKELGSLKATAFARPCSKDPCKFDGVCKEDGQGYKCECKLFRHGDNCEKGIGLVPGLIIIVACLLVVFILLILICLYCRRQSEYYDKDFSENGIKMNPTHKGNADHLASSTNYSFAEEYEKAGKYELMSDHFTSRASSKALNFTLNEQIKEKEVQYAKVDFQSFNKTKTTEENPTKTSPQATLYTDVVSALMTAPIEEGQEEKTLEESYRDTKVDENENQPMIWYDNVEKKSTSNEKENGSVLAVGYVAPSESPRDRIYVQQHNPTIHYGSATDKKQKEEFPMVHLAKTREETPETQTVHVNAVIAHFEEPQQQQSTFMANDNGRYSKPTPKHVKVEENKPIKPQEERPNTLNVPYDEKPTVRFNDVPQQISSPPPIKENEQRPVRRTKPPVPLPNILKRKDDDKPLPPSNNGHGEVPAAVQVNGMQQQAPVVCNEPPPTPPNSLTVNENDNESVESYGKPPDIPVLYDLKEEEEEVVVTPPEEHRFDNTIDEAPINFKVNANENEFEVGHSFDLDPKESEGFSSHNRLTDTHM